MKIENLDARSAQEVYDADLKIFEQGSQRLKEKYSAGWRFVNRRFIRFRYFITPAETTSVSQEITHKGFGEVYTRLLASCDGFSIITPLTSVAALPDPYHGCGAHYFTGYTTNPGEVAKIVNEQIRPCEYVEIPSIKTIVGKTLGELPAPSKYYDLDMREQLVKKYGKGATIIAAITDEGFGGAVVGIQRKLQPWECLIILDEDNRFTREPSQGKQVFFYDRVAIDLARKELAENIKNKIPAIVPLRLVVGDKLLQITPDESGTIGHDGGLPESSDGMRSGGGSGHVTGKPIIRARPSWFPIKEPLEKITADNIASVD